MIRSFLSLLSLLSLLLHVNSFPFLTHQSPVQLPPRHPSVLTRSAHPVRAAEQYSSEFPYTGAVLDGLPGTGIGGVQVPASGDTAHNYQDPPLGAYRGPCPGLNAMANHGFISRDGITNFEELVAGQQNMYNIGWDLAVFLAVVGIVFDGDIVTQKLSIGGDATSQTAFLGGLLGDEGGLDTHDTFEVDASLSRNDYYLADGDDYTLNTTLFSMMTETVGTTSSPENPMFNASGVGLFKYERYLQSLNTNPKFYFGPKQLIFYGAASFLYEVFPSSANGNRPDLPTLSSFFGAVLDPNSPSGFSAQPERAPPGWYNRVAPYGLVDVIVQLNLLYLQHVVLFGGNTGVGNFDLLGSFAGAINNGMYTPPATSQEVACLLYNLVTDDVPDSLGNVAKLPLEILNFALEKLNPIFAPLGCTLLNIAD